MTNAETFDKVYRASLAQAVAEYPDEYPWFQEGVVEVEEVADRMLDSVFHYPGRWNKDGRAFKATCKTLGIRHTYKAIFAYIGEGA